MSIQLTGQYYYKPAYAKPDNKKVVHTIRKDIARQDHVLVKSYDEVCNQGYPSDGTMKFAGHQLQTLSEGPDEETASRVTTTGPVFSGTAAVAVMASPVDISTLLLTKESQKPAGVSE